MLENLTQFWLERFTHNWFQGGHTHRHLGKERVECRNSEIEFQEQLLGQVQGRPVRRISSVHGSQEGHYSGVCLHQFTSFMLYFFVEVLGLTQLLGKLTH